MNRPRLSVAALFVLCLLYTIVAAPAADAQHWSSSRSHRDQWSQPVVADTGLDVHGQGFLDGDTLVLPPGEQISIEARGYDQDGNSFPQERFRFGFDLDNSCRGLVQLEDFEHGTIHVRTGDRTGTCSVLYWVPNNMNLDHTLRIEVGRRNRPPAVEPGFRPPGGRPQGIAVSSHDELVATSVYQAILGRQPDNRWLDDASLQVSRGKTRDLIRSLLDSSEFRGRRSRLSPDQILESFYRGLLGRDLDPSGRRTYLDDVQKGHYEDVIVDILSSDEYHQRSPGDVARPRRP